MDRLWDPSQPGMPEEPPLYMDPPSRIHLYCKVRYEVLNREYVRRCDFQIVDEEKRLKRLNKKQQTKTPQTKV